MEKNIKSVRFSSKTSQIRSLRKKTTDFHTDRGDLDKSITQPRDQVVVRLTVHITHEAADWQGR